MQARVWEGGGALSAGAAPKKKKSRAHLRLVLRPSDPSSHSVPLPTSNASCLIQVQCGVNAGFQEQTNTQTDDTGNSDCFVE